MKRTMAMLAAALLLAACGGEEPAVQTTPTPAETTTSPTPTATATGDAVELELEAEDIAFDPKKLEAPAGAAVTLDFKNRDGKIPHNFALYESGQKSLEGDAIFQGETGTGSMTYEFAAPAEPGDYFFRCDVHPSMSGTFTVT